MNVKKLVKVAVGVLLVFVVVVALTRSCGGEDAQTTTSAPTAGGQIVFAVNDLPVGWNPASAAWTGPATTMARTFFDPLVIIDEDGGWAPYLADFIPNEDFTVWELKLRSGITFHDGEPFNAAAVVANIQNAIGGIVLGPPLRSVTSFEAVDDLTVRVTLNEQYANFPLLFTSQGGYMISPNTLARFAEGDSTAPPVGTGPWRFSVGDSSRITVTKNDNYWREDENGQKLPYLEKIVFVLEPDILSRRLLAEEQAVDALLDNTPSQVKRWQEGNYPEDFTLLVDRNFSDRTYANLNTQAGPFADVRLREAVAIGTQRENIADIASDGFFPVTDGPFSPVSEWYAESEWPAYDPERAKSLVAQWTAEAGGAKPTVSLIVSQGSLQVAIGQELQKQWNELGFDVTLRSLPTQTFVVQLVTGGFDASIVQQFSAVDPIADESFWRAQTIGGPGELSLNFPRYSNDVIEQGLTQGRVTTDAEVRKAGYTAVWREWARTFPYLFFFNSPQAVLATPRVNDIGVLSSPNGEPAAPFSWGATWLTEAWAPIKTPAQGDPITTTPSP